MKQKLIVLSADALVAEDMEYFKTLPNFQKYLSGGACAKTVKTCYPTITYPAHTTIATGVYPDRHCVLGNDDFDPYTTARPWKWFHSSVHAPDIFSVCKRAGLTTAAVFWPCTGNHPDIDYLIDEYWAQGEGDTSREAFIRSGSDARTLKIIDRHVGSLVDRKHPIADEFVISCAADIIREYAPDLIMIHPANIDAYRHGNGLFNDAVTRGIDETDRWLGMLLSAADDAGTLENTNVVLLSDHGQLEIKRIIKPNVLLADAGFIELDADGKIKHAKAYVHSGGMSALCYVYDKSCYNELYNYLIHLRDEGIYGFSEVIPESEAREKYRLGGDFAFALETDGYTSFSDDCRRPLVRAFSNADYRLGRATHGYLPDKGPQPVFCAKGPAFLDSASLDRIDAVDEAPTFARILGTEMSDVDGRVLTELLK